MVDDICDFCCENRETKPGLWSCNLYPHDCKGEHRFNACPDCFARMRLREVKE